MKLIKKIAGGLLILLFIVGGTFLIITFAYENEVKAYMIKQLNANLKTKVIVDSKNISFSLFNSFPYASLSFKDVVMLGAPTGSAEVLPCNSRKDKGDNKEILNQDTLFWAQNISLQFNILDILSRKYIVKKISADNGKVNLKLGTDGSENWDVWKRTGDTASVPAESAFNLEKFHLKNISFRYADFKGKNDISCIIHSGTIGGKFTNKEYDLFLKGDLLVNRFDRDSVNYLDTKPVTLDMTLKVDKDRNQYQFSEAILSVADLTILVGGTYTSGATSKYVDVWLKGKDMDVQSVLSLLPEKYHKEISDYDSEGEFYCNAHIIGKTDNENSPQVKADFGITRADIMQRSSGIVLKDVRLQGDYYSSSEKDYLNLKTFSAMLINGTLAGSVRVDKLASPSVTASFTAHMLLNDIRRLAKIDTIWNYPIETLAGSVQINMKYKGKLNISGRYARSDFKNMILSGGVILENAGMKIKNSSLSFDSINGSFILNDNSITVNSFSGKTSKSDFYLKGVLKNILAYSFAKDADMNVEATFQSNNFDLNEFLLNQKESSKRDTVYNVHFSPQMNFILNSNIGHLAFRKFEANNVRGTFHLRNQKLIADPISFSTMDGSVIASGMIDGSSDTALLVTCDADLKELNISKLFSQFEDFGQTTLTHGNLKGLATAKVQFASVWTSALSVDLNRIYVRSDLAVEKGELLKFEPMKALSRYIALSELGDIKFPLMRNQIEIKNQKIFIPKMNIHSSALDLTLSGTHSFHNEIDYHIQVLMSDILFQKARKAKKENNEFGVIEDDKSGKTSLFLSMTGTAERPVFKYDKQGAKQNLKENITNEKQTLKQILKDEFGWFKRDSVQHKKQSPGEDKKFVIKWDEDEKEKKKKEDDDF